MKERTQVKLLKAAGFGLVALGIWVSHGEQLGLVLLTSFGAGIAGVAYGYEDRP